MMVSQSSLVLSSPVEVGKRWRKLFALIPGYDPVGTAAPGEWFDEAVADRAVEFFPACLQLIEGEKADRPFMLEPWQQAVIGCLMGWKREDGTRRYREAMIYVPRKNGKTPWMAGLVNLVMFTDHEPGAQLYSAAADREQASLIYRHASGMIAREPELSSRARCYRTFKSIEYSAEGTTYKALSSEADTKHGLGAHLIIVDELHAHPNSDLVDVLQTSTAARREPLMVHITTADYDRDSVCNRKHDYATKVRDGVFDDSSFLPVLYEASVEDDWTDPSVWSKANPNLGVSVKLDYLERECRRAKEEPSYENTFKRLHLNIKTQQDVRWIQLEAWDNCDGECSDKLLGGRLCYGGLDLSTKTDITAWVLVFPPTEEDPMYRILPRFWVPGDNAERRERKDRVPYMTWGRDPSTGMTLTDGNVIDYDIIKAQIAEDHRIFEVAQTAYDPWNATQIALQLADSGANVIEFRQGYKSMSEPSKEFEKLVMSNKIAHGNNPVLRWMSSHVGIELDPAGNIKPSKKKSTERIDGIIATVMGLGCAMVGDHSPYEPTVYSL